MRQLLGAGAQITHFHGLPSVEGSLKARQSKDRWCADTHPLDACACAVAQIKGEGRFMAEPAREGRAHLFGVAWRNIYKGWRARAAVEVFIGAAHGEIGFAF